ncbi:hypothetical protein DENSPDRAFT_439491 [Dentipellis sp. KUC8613]|nr:hypothetical protein DENSPDRAFT_439491 [Dentipellis sp. KUC8613]
MTNEGTQNPNMSMHISRLSHRNQVEDVYEKDSHHLHWLWARICRTTIASHDSPLFVVICGNPHRERRRGDGNEKSLLLPSLRRQILPFVDATVRTTADGACPICLPTGVS